jgi:hypothetical protein
MDPITSSPASPQATINQRPIITIHNNIIDLGSTRINPDLIPLMIAGFGSSPMAVNLQLPKLPSRK